MLQKLLQEKSYHFFFKCAKLTAFDKLLIDKHLTKCYSFVKELTTTVRAIGFKNIISKKALNELLYDVLETPTEQKQVNFENNENIVDRKIKRDKNCACCLGKFYAIDISFSNVPNYRTKTSKF